MAKIGLVSSIADAALAIDLGRKGFATRGKAEEGIKGDCHRSVYSSH